MGGQIYGGPLPGRDLASVARYGRTLAVRRCRLGLLEDVDGGVLRKGEAGGGRGGTTVTAGHNHLQEVQPHLRQHEADGGLVVVLLVAAAALSLVVEQRRRRREVLHGQTPRESDGR